MAAYYQMLMLLVVCIAVVGGQRSQISLWPPKCCLENQFSMTYRGVVGDLVVGKNFGYSNVARLAFDFKNQMMASEGVVTTVDGIPYPYRSVQDFKKASIWTITNSSCTWAKQEGNMGTTCIGQNNGETVYHGSFNYMGYIPTYTWRTTMWEENQKGFLYLSVTEDECLPVTSNFGGYNDQVVPKPETVFNGGNFYNYTSGIHPDDYKRYFDVPNYCPPAPPPDMKDMIETEKMDSGIFAPAKILMDMRDVIRRVPMK